MFHSSPNLGIRTLQAPRHKFSALTTPPAHGRCQQSACVNTTSRLSASLPSAGAISFHLDAGDAQGEKYSHRFARQCNPHGLENHHTTVTRASSHFEPPSRQTLSRLSSSKMPSCFSWIHRKLLPSYKGAGEIGARCTDAGQPGRMVEDMSATSAPPLPKTKGYLPSRGATSPRALPPNEQASTDSGEYMIQPQPKHDPEHRFVDSSSDSSALETTRTFPPRRSTVASGETSSPPSLDGTTDFRHDECRTLSEQDRQSPSTARPVLDTAPVPTEREHRTVPRRISQGHPYIPAGAVTNANVAHPTHIITTNLGPPKTLSERMYPRLSCHFHLLMGNGTRSQPLHYPWCCP